MKRHIYKPGDIVSIFSPKTDPLDGPLSLPIAIKTNTGLRIIADTDLWKGVLSDRRLYLHLPDNPVYGLVICSEGKEDGDYVPLDGDEPSHRERRLFIMLSINGEPEYVRVVEGADY